jgi:hypothetical protein
MENLDCYIDTITNRKMTTLNLCTLLLVRYAPLRGADSILTWTFFLEHYNSGITEGRNVKR